MPTRNKLQNVWQTRARPTMALRKPGDRSSIGKKPGANREAARRVAERLKYAEQAVAETKKLQGVTTRPQRHLDLTTRSGAEGRYVFGPAADGSCPHAPPCLRLQARKRWPRHARDPGLSRASQYPEYDALYRLGAAAVQGIFSRLMGRHGHCQCKPRVSHCRSAAPPSAFHFWAVILTVSRYHNPCQRRQQLDYNQKNEQQLQLALLQFSNTRNVINCICSIGAK